MNKLSKISYCEALLNGFEYLLENHQEVFVIGQGLWSPWYVGNSMKDLDKKYGKSRIIDTPISENAVTGAAVGASLCGSKPIVVHPRMDFMLYAMDPIINQAAKWSYMFGGKSNPQVTIRSIINRGGEQGAQHSQSLHSLFAHIPGLRVVMPYSVQDARDLLIASVLNKDPVVFIDDRWLYEDEEFVSDIQLLDLSKEKPKTIIQGNDLTIVSSSYSTKIAKKAIKLFQSKSNKTIELIDIRVINPLDTSSIINSVRKTKRLIVVDGGWKNCGLGSSIISAVCEKIEPSLMKVSPTNICLESTPAPASNILEKVYYKNEIDIVNAIEKNLLNF